MSKAEKYRKALEDAEKLQPKGLEWSKNGYARVEGTGEVYIHGGHLIAKDALRLRDWLTEVFGD